MEKIKFSFERSDERGVFRELLNDNSKKWSVVNHGVMKKGAVIGNHYHKETDVLVFLLKGNAEAVSVELESGKRKSIELKEGEGMLLGINNAHAIRFLSDSEFIMLKTKYKPDEPDTYKYKVV